MADYQISFQLYSARKFPPLKDQLRVLAEIGYDAVEPYGAIYEEDPAAFRGMINAAGLDCPSAHVSLAALDADRKRCVDIARTLGLSIVVVPFLPPPQRPTDATGWKAVGRRLAEHASALADAGLRLAWHNHDFEYVPLADGSRPIEHLLAPRNVMWEADIGWIHRASAEPVGALSEFPGKLAAFHIKDVASAGTTGEDGWADVGSGRIDWRRLWPSIAGSGARLLVCEHDNPADWRRFARRSYDYLSRLAMAGAA
jgi:sugar phosphate isomerase/epimerase